MFAGAFALIIVPSLDLVIYKMAATTGNTIRGLRTCRSPSRVTRGKPIQGTRFVEGRRAGDDGIRRVLEMVCAGGANRLMLRRVLHQPFQFLQPLLQLRVLLFQLLNSVF
jgi:hypothetical protein